MPTSYTPMSQKRDMGHPFFCGWSDVGHRPVHQHSRTNHHHRRASKTRIRNLSVRGDCKRKFAAGTQLHIVLPGRNVDVGVVAGNAAVKIHTRDHADLGYTDLVDA